MTVSWGEIYEQFASAYGWTIEEINNVTLCQALMLMHYRSKRVQSYFDFANDALNSLMGDSSPVTQGTSPIANTSGMQDINSININPKAMRKAAQDILGVKEGEPHKDGVVYVNVKKGKAPWRTQN